MTNMEYNRELDKLYNFTIESMKIVKNLNKQDLGRRTDEISLNIWEMLEEIKREIARYDLTELETMAEYDDRMLEEGEKEWP